MAFGDRAEGVGPAEIRKEMETPLLLVIQGKPLCSLSETVAAASPSPSGAGGTQVAP